MTIIQLELEDDLLALLHHGNQPVQHAARELIVLELFRRGKLSSGKAAKLVGMPLAEFIPYASRLGIPFFEMTEEEWEAECRQIEKVRHGGGAANG